MQKKMVITCLVNFFIAALMGLALRYSYLNPIPVNYRFLTHGHSHIAMLGWAYLMIYTFFVYYFIPKPPPVFNRLFWITQLSVVGMMISFPIQGYATVSISFSTLHIFCSYFFVRLFWKHHHINSKPQRQLVKASLLFMLISTIGVWCLGPAVGLLGQASAFYQIAIQFFLHFQFNGWFLLAVLALLFKHLNIQDPERYQKFFKILIISTVLTFALPIHWFVPHPVLLWINSLGIILQLYTLYLFLKLIKPQYNTFIHTQSKLLKLLLQFGLSCFILKTSVQGLSLIPAIADLAHQQRNLVIGFIHLTMLGVISGFLFAFILQSKLVSQTKLLSFGIQIFILGFVLTEFILVSQSFMIYAFNQVIPSYYNLIFVSSIFLPLGIVLLLFNLITTKYEHQTSKTT